MRRRVLAWLAAPSLLLGLAAAMCGSDDGRDGPWRATYFAATQPGGPLVERFESDVRMFWTTRAPLPELPRDGFGVRLRACFELLSDTPLILRLAADDSASLEIDGESVLGWEGPGRHRSRQVMVRPGPGLHPIEVRYTDLVGKASVQLQQRVEGHWRPLRVRRENARGGCD